MRPTEAFSDIFQEPQLVFYALLRSSETRPAYEGEAFRLCVPPLPPPGRTNLKDIHDTGTESSSWQLGEHELIRWPPASIYFTTDDRRSVSMEELLLFSRSSSDSDYLRQKMGTVYCAPGSDTPVFGLVLRIAWPGYPQYMSRRISISSSAMRGELAAEVAKAYLSFMLQAPRHCKWRGTVDEERWRILDDTLTIPDPSDWKSCLCYRYILSTFHLVALHRIGENTFQAEVHEVFRPIELPDTFKEIFIFPDDPEAD
ncbi:hypothetical protein L226DRAFT_616566 [Lentinus tigrinus ALCF2SS1-7]|uniref:Uncharacterized protein n=1 Tax=Lentinus tigrinus ALCF2SS1-6 TaxID=1328759 RepID=A0A5C2S5E2_9APHY|nr:hypothetical protein L227DRAFT_654552 [Lentinus tigrinus ALCF2SS1-6]RPD69795.1 hypothetical protein L226DRAFT_616566 [Lentinus tigrinus ALCF2SS1-7]